MKITFTMAEANEIENIMDKLEPNSFKEFMNATAQNPLIKTRIVPAVKPYIEITVDKDYTAEFLTVYGKYLSILIAQVKAVQETVTAFTEDAQQVVTKYTAMKGAKEGHGTKA